MTSAADNLTDQDLIRQTLAGEASAFERLIGKYQDRLFHSMTQVLRNRADAEDIVQDAFVKAFTKLSSFQGDSQFYTWLYRIAHNRAIDQVRREQRKPAVSLEDSGGGLANQVPGTGAAPSERMEQQEQACMIEAALGRLSEEHRTILVLREMDELDYDAIGNILGIAVGTVRSRLHRARSQLKAELERVTH